MALNPYRCKSETARRLSLAASAVAVIAWIIFVFIASDGFRHMRAQGWALLILVPPLGLGAAMLVALAAGVIGKPARIAISAGLLWAFSVFAWGLIGDWELTFTPGEYAGFLVLPPIGAMLAAVLWWWVQQPSPIVSAPLDPPCAIPRPVSPDASASHTSAATSAYPQSRRRLIPASAYFYLLAASYAVAIALRVLRSDSINSINDVASFLGEGFALAALPILAVRYLSQIVGWLLFLLVVAGTLIDVLGPGR